MSVTNHYRETNVRSVGELLQGNIFTERIACKTGVNCRLHGKKTTAKIKWWP